MLISKREQYEKSIVLDNGWSIAKYKNLTLTSAYQPIFDHSLSLVGLEALVRIENRLGEPVRPDLFFSSDTIELYEKLNVERLSRAIHIRNFHKIGLDKIKLFLNVLPSGHNHSSVRDVANGLLVRRLKELNIKNDQLVLEILEYDSNNEELKSIAAELKKLGFSIAMDDFGREASDRNRAICIQPNIIKIDKSLLNRYMAGDSHCLLECLELARALQAQTVVEGVETESELTAMQKLNIDMYQGYYLGRPNSSFTVKNLFEPQSFKLFNKMVKTNIE